MGMHVRSARDSQHAHAHFTVPATSLRPVTPGGRGAGATLVNIFAQSLGLGPFSRPQAPPLFWPAVYTTPSEHSTCEASRTLKVQHLNAGPLAWVPAHIAAQCKQRVESSARQSTYSRELIASYHVQRGLAVEEGHWR